MGQIIKLTESQFKKVIKETIKKVLKEENEIWGGTGNWGDNGDGDGEYNKRNEPVLAIKSIDETEYAQIVEGIFSQLINHAKVDSKSGSGHGYNFLVEKIDEAISNTKMENWGAWLGVKLTGIVSELDNYKIFRERDSFIADTNGNTIKPVYRNNVYAQITGAIFNPKPGKDEYQIHMNFYIKQ